MPLIEKVLEDQPVLASLRDKKWGICNRKWRGSLANPIRAMKPWKSSWPNATVMHYELVHGKTCCLPAYYRTDWIPSGSTHCKLFRTASPPPIRIGKKFNYRHTSMPLNGPFSKPTKINHPVHDTYENTWMSCDRKVRPRNGDTTWLATTWAVPCLASERIELQESPLNEVSKYSFSPEGLYTEKRGICIEKFSCFTMYYYGMNFILGPIAGIVRRSLRFFSTPFHSENLSLQL